MRESRRTHRVRDHIGLIRTILPMIALTMALFTAPAIMAQSMTDFPEDEHYQGPPGLGPRDHGSPQAARAAFGPPAPWMRWGETGDFQGSVGAYAGLRQQDAERPYIFAGGGFNSWYAFTGNYTFVCSQGTLTPNLRPENVYDMESPPRPATFMFPAVPASVDVRRNGEVDASCRIFPADLYSRLRVSPDSLEEFQKNMIEWKERCAALDALPLPMGMDTPSRNCFRLKGRSTSSDGVEVYSLDIAAIGHEGRWLDPNDMSSRTVEFEVPEIVRPFFSGLSPEDIDYSASFRDGGNHMMLILKNGNYLRVRTMSEIRAGF